MRYGATQVFEEISRKIADGTYTSGMQLVEADLAAEYNVSRNTIKKVLLMLENKGLVTTELNKGSRVRRFSHQEIEEMMQVRSALEELVTRLAVPLLSDEKIAQMEAELRTMKAHLDANELMLYSEGNRRFHQVLYDACPNRTAVNMLLDLKEQISKFNIKTILIAGRGQHSFEEHSAILRDIQRRDAESAAEHMRQHISGVEQTMHAYQQFQM